MKFAQELMKQIKAHGYEIYLVGGYPRDCYLGRSTNDFDLCTNATPKELISILKSFHLDTKYQDFGVLKLTHDGVSYEITTYRKEGSYSHHRTPKEITFIQELKEDLKRRDFTINTLCMDEAGTYLDLLGAKHDLDQRLLQTVGDSDQKLEEDALRILRAIRFASELDFHMSKALEVSILKKKHLLKELPKKQVKKELERIFSYASGRALLKKFQVLEELDFSVYKDLLLLYNMD